MVTWQTTARAMLGGSSWQPSATEGRLGRMLGAGRGLKHHGTAPLACSWNERYPGLHPHVHNFTQCTSVPLGDPEGVSPRPTQWNVDTKAFCNLGRWWLLSAGVVTLSKRYCLFACLECSLIAGEDHNNILIVVSFALDKKSFSLDNERNNYQQ